MGGFLFVTQAMLDSWAEQGKIDFVGDVMTILSGAGSGRSYALEPAVRFMKVVGADSDPNALLAKVKTASHLKDMGAELFGDAVVIGDVAYEVQAGFLAEAAALQAAAAAQRSPASESAEPRPAAPDGGPTVEPPPDRGAAKSPPAVPLPKSLEERKKEADLLARFLLDKLS